MKTTQTKQKSSGSQSVADRLSHHHDPSGVMAQKSGHALIDQSPRQAAQGRFLAQLQKESGGADFLPVQRLPEEEELPKQGKFEAAQRMEEEEPLQGKFETVQRIEDEEEPLQGKFETAQRVEDEEEPVQGKFEAVQRLPEEEELPAQGKFSAEAIAQRAADPAPKTNNTGLPDNLKSGVESLSGLSLDNVQVHYNSDKPAQLNALAYTQGTDIHVAPGQEKHLPHEAWHVVQQAQGRVQPTTQMKEGVPVNDDPGLEHEADVMGGKALLTHHENETSENAGDAIGNIDGRQANRTTPDHTYLENNGIRAGQLKEQNGSTVVQCGYYKGGRYVTDDEINYHAMYDRFLSTWSFSEKAAEGAYVDPASRQKKIPDPVWQGLFNQLDALITAACAGGMMITENFHRFNPGTPVALKFAQVEAAGTGGAGGLLPAGVPGPGNIPMVDHPDEVAVTAFIGRAQASYLAWTAHPTMAARGPQDPPPRLSAAQSNILSHRILPGGWTFHISLSGTWALHHAGPPHADIDQSTGQPATFIYHV